LQPTPNLEAEHRNADEQMQQEDAETPLPPLTPVLDDLKYGQAFIEGLRNASLANEHKQLPGFVADRLHSPIIGHTELLPAEKLSHVLLSWNITQKMSCFHCGSPSGDWKKSLGLSR
jgi:hypothetical protein